MVKMDHYIDMDAENKKEENEWDRLCPKIC